MRAPTVTAAAAAVLLFSACANGQGVERAATGAAGTANQGQAVAPDTPAVSITSTSTSTSTSTGAPAAAPPSTSSTTTAPPAAPHERPAPTSAEELTSELNAAELAVRDEALSIAERDSWGRRQQTLYRHLAEQKEWAPAVLASVDPSISEAVALNWKARENLAALLNTETLHDELPAWRVTAPPPAETLIEYYKQGEAEWGIQWEFLAGINLIETRMGRIQGISTAGAVGPMQFLPTTWAECCEGDPTNPADAIVGAAKYLTIRGGPENMDRAIWGYNNSDYYVNAVTAYANVLMADERAYYGYHAWEIYFLSTEGLVRIPVGYEQSEPIAVTAWLADNPGMLFSR